MPHYLPYIIKINFLQNFPFLSNSQYLTKCLKFIKKYYFMILIQSLIHSCYCYYFFLNDNYVIHLNNHQFITVNLCFLHEYFYLQIITFHCFRQPSLLSKTFYCFSLMCSTGEININYYFNFN